MKARALLEGGAFEPEQLRIITTAFETVWAVIAKDVGSNPSAIEAARLKLAGVVMQEARRGVGSVDGLKAAALEVMFRKPTEL